MQIAVDTQTDNNPLRSRFGLVRAIELFLDPCICVGCLFLTAMAFDPPLAPRHVILAVLTLSMTFPGSLRLSDGPGRMVSKTVMDLALVALLLILFGHATGYGELFPSSFIAGWVFSAFAALLVSHEVMRLALPKFIARGHQRTAVIVGNNEMGAVLAQKFKSNIYLGVRFLGFFEERNRERLPHSADQRQLGPLSELAGYIKHNHVEHIYITLPISSARRIQSLLDDIRDTTASIFFVPDIFTMDLIQGHVDTISGVPVVGICETPFTGWRGVLKRLSDVVLSALILLLISPIMAAVAIGVRLGSPGPIIFAQRRYGLDGREIIVYKFRSMSVTEDGDKQYVQVKRGDARVTPFGAFIRKTSLDELPQFINVLQGRMSVVGPRPHAVAVNEQYRKLISGYMVRHKVKPGITGWAQVNGYRGGDDLEHMKGRIRYDLEYLRDWSLRLDLLIIFRTVGLVVRDSRAY